MAKIKDTNVDRGSVLLECETIEDRICEYLDAGDNFKDGTILAFHVAKNRFVPFKIGGNAAEDGVPSAVMIGDPDNLPAAPAVGNTLRWPVLLSGKVRRERLIVSATDNNAGITDAHINSLRDYGVIARSVNELTDRTTGTA